jgi:hypothetical protein
MLLQLWAGLPVKGWCRSGEDPEGAEQRPRPRRKSGRAGVQPIGFTNRPALAARWPISAQTVENRVTEPCGADASRAVGKLGVIPLLATSIHEPPDRWTSLGDERSPVQIRAPRLTESPPVAWLFLVGAASSPAGAWAPQDPPSLPRPSEIDVCVFWSDLSASGRLEASFIAHRRVGGDDSNGLRGMTLARGFLCLS